MAEHAEGMTRGARRAVIALFLIMCALAAGNLIFSAGQVHHLAGVVARQDAQARAQAAVIAQLRAQQAQLQRQQLASCGFAGHLGGVPLPAAPKPGKVGVQLVTDSRAQWRALHCPGALPPPSAGLRKWAAYYHLSGE